MFCDTRELIISLFQSRAVCWNRTSLAKGFVSLLKFYLYNQINVPKALKVHKQGEKEEVCVQMQIKKNAKQKLKAPEQFSPWEKQVYSI